MSTGLTRWLHAHSGLLLLPSLGAAPGNRGVFGLCHRLASGCGKTSQSEQGKSKQEFQGFHEKIQRVALSPTRIEPVGESGKIWAIV